MRPDSSQDLLYDDEEPTIPRMPSEPRISRARPAAQIVDLGEEDTDTDVDGKTLPADDEPTTANLPPDVRQALLGMSADDTVTAIKKDDRS